MIKFVTTNSDYKYPYLSVSATCATYTTSNSVPILLVRECSCICCCLFLVYLLKTVLTQDRFCDLLTYHPISIKEDTRAEDSGDLAHAVQQILRHVVLRGTSPSPLTPAVSLGCLESAQNILTSHGMIKLYTDCAGLIQF